MATQTRCNSPAFTSSVPIKAPQSLSTLCISSRRIYPKCQQQQQQKVAQTQPRRPLLRTRQQTLQDSRISRDGWGDSILQVQKQLFDHYAPGKFTWRNCSITLQNGHIINIVKATPKRTVHNRSEFSNLSNKNVTLTLIHGWGAGIGHFTRCLPYLISNFNAIYMIDLPGMAASSRPSFPRHDRNESLHYFLRDLQQTYNHLIETDKTFRNSNRHVAAHSLGAYITSEWLLRNQNKSNSMPNLFHKFYLISPVGIPHRPAPLKRKQLSLFSIYLIGRNILWSSGLTPQDVLRILPWPLAKIYLRHFINTRFTTGKENAMDDTEMKMMIEYCYRISIGPAASEKAMTSILIPGAWAVVPLCDRLPLLKNVPCTFLYGDMDWMDWRAGEQVRRNMKVPTRLIRIKNADHNMFLDNPKAFSEEILNAASDFENNYF